MTSHRAAALAAAALLCAPGRAAAEATDCPKQIREFALLAHMGMEAESVAAYQALRERPQCRASLPQPSAAPPLPDPGDIARIIALGKQLHAQARDVRALQTGKALREGEIPQASADALRGLGPENAVRALGGMALDVLAAGLDSRQRLPQARAARQVGDAIRGDELRWSAPPTQGGPAATALRQPALDLDPAAVNAASCSGTYGFLEPRLRAYAAPSLAAARQAVLGESIPAMLQGARQQAGSKAQALRLLDEQVKEYDRAANEAAQTALQTDGSSGQADVARATADTLELDYPCDQGPSIHVTGVCAYIAFRWGSLATRASAALVERCW